MESERLTIHELADASGLSPRAIRFYVQRGLLRPPLGRGRGRHYDRKHLEQLRQLGAWQRAGHSLDAIRRLQQGEQIAAPERVRPVRAAGPQRTLWSRTELARGVELHVDEQRSALSSEQLDQLQAFVQQLLDPPGKRASKERGT